jgi:multiple sugar transport system permease protein
VSQATSRISHPAAGKRLADDEGRLGWLMLSPAILYIALSVGAPFVLAIIYSFSTVTVGAHQLEWAGLRNFSAAVSDPAFLRALRNTFVFAIASQIIVLVLATILAVALQRDFRGKWFVRFLILLPWVAPISLGSIGWLWILDPIYSVINWMLKSVGILGPYDSMVWLGEPFLAMSSIVTIHVWRTLPLATVLFLGGLSSIPQELNDAAAIDGAGFFRKLFQITLPLLLPIILVAVLFGVVFAVTDMIVIYVLTGGGPYNTTQVLASLAFYQGINGGDLAGGSAIALFLLPVLAACAIALLRLARRAEVA